MRESERESKIGERKADRHESKIKNVTPAQVLREATVEIVVFGTHPSPSFSSKGTGNADGVCYV